MKGAIEALYEQVRNAGVATSEAAGGTVEQVAPGIRVLALRTPTLPPAAHTNVYLVGPEIGPVAVIDPGSPYPDQQAALDEVLSGLPIAMILLTHHHGDHVGGAGALAARWGVPIAAHAATAHRLDGVVDVTRPLADGETVHGLTAVHTPGHADGHLCFRHAEATIVGDMVAGIGTILVDPEEGDMADYLASLERLRAAPPARLLPAHGPPIADGHAKLEAYLAHRRGREQRVLGALTERPAAVAALLPGVYGDTPAALWPLAERSLRAHLIKLGREGLAREDGLGRWSRL